MKLKLELYQRESAELVNVGTLNKLVGVGGTFGPSSSRNFLDHSKRVNILAKNKAGESVLVNCSTAVSKALRNQELKLSELGALPIFESNFVAINKDSGEEEDVTSYFIGFEGVEGNGAVVTVTAKSLTTKAVTNTFNWEDVIAL